MSGYKKLEDEVKIDVSDPPAPAPAKPAPGIACAGLTVGCPKESYPNERRVALAPPVRGRASEGAAHPPAQPPPPPPRPCPPRAAVPPH